MFKQQTMLYSHKLHVHVHTKLAYGKVQAPVLFLLVDLPTLFLFLVFTFAAVDLPVKTVKICTLWMM